MATIGINAAGFGKDPLFTRQAGRACLGALWTGDFGVWRAALLIAAFSFLSLRPAVAREDSLPGSQNITFERDIRPILKAHCFHCHGEGEKARGDVDLRLRRLILAKSESGHVVVPGKPLESVLFQMVSTGEMPKEGKPLTADQVAKIRSWIEQGARTIRPEPDEVPKFHITEEERAFWSFQPIRRPMPPPVENPQALRSPLDAFLLARLEERGISFAPPADKRTLLRRVYYDLTGLPPAPGETAMFLSDTSADAYEKMVDRVLATDAYGERWARHWLDVAGYADSNGGVETDSERAWAWRYRDYVIRSLNADKPFDRFIREQLAGDEMVSPPYEDLAGEALDPLIATGFLRMAPDPTGDGPPDPDLARNQVIADTLQIVSSSLLGLTVQCAQCHDHRYDPIPQSDYYRLRAVFEPAFDWKNWKNPGQRLVSLMGKEDREKADAIEKEAKKIDQEAQKLHDEFIERFVQKQLELVPEGMREPVLNARRTQKDKRTEEHKTLLRQYPTFQDNILLGEVDRDGAKQVDEVRKRATDLRATKPADTRVHCLVEEAGKNVETYVFHRGDHQQPREKVDPGGLTVLASFRPQDIAEANAASRMTGRRSAFAAMLTDGSHPLTARVLVNRVWHHLFGVGIVPTPADFGALGEPPTHPELLDWLASEFMENGWKLKSLHRTILLSAVYRQGSVHAAAQAVDPDNRLLGRMRLKRRDAESVRDSMLLVSARMNRKMFGPPVPTAVNPQGEVVVGNQTRDGNGDPAGVSGADGEEFRRSIYVLLRRSAPVGLIETFDAPALTPNCEARPVSTVPPQSLMLMNGQFVLDRGHDLAERLRREQPGDARGQVALLWRLLFAAEPAPEELQRSLVYLAEQGEALRAPAPAEPAASKDEKTTNTPADDPQLRALASLCQALLSANRFLYVD